MLRKILFLLLLLPFVAKSQTALTYPRQDTIDVNILFGESNASGQALNSTVLGRYLNTRSEIQIQRNATGTTGKFQPLVIAANSAGGNNQIAMNSNPPATAVFGMELAMAQQVDSGLLQNPTYLIKCAVGGAKIADWLPTGTLEPQFRPFLDSAFAQLNRLGKPYRVYVWESIGLNDQAGGTLVDSFVSRLAQHRSYWRSRYNANMVFMETNFSNTGTGYTFPYASAINAIPATDAHFHSIPCNGATYNAGETNVHWDLNGLGTIAHNMMDTMLVLTGRGAMISAWFDIGRGSEVWIKRRWDNGAIASYDGVNVPAGNSVWPATNFYTRFLWNQEATCNCGIEGATAGSYTFTAFDNDFHNAMDNHELFSFRVMPVCDGCGGTVPAYVKTLIEANPNANLRGYTAADGMYIPNWNNPDYLLRYRAMLVALANHIAITSYKPPWSAVPIPYSKVLYEVDIGGYGNYGEWHQFPWVQDVGFPARIIPTATSLDSLINMNLNVFPNNPAMGLIATFGTGAGTAGNQFEPPTEVGYRMLTSTNNWGPIGWRRDNWGDSNYNNGLLRNSRSYNPGTGNVAFQPLIMNKYKTAPISGEPLNGMTNPNAWGCGSPYCDLPIQTFLYHPTTVGNGNFADPTLLSTQQNFQMASRQMGYKLFIGGGSMTTTLSSGGMFNIAINWYNLGQTPTYQTWRVRYELRNPTTHAVVWTGTSTFNPRPLLPYTTLQQNDNFTLGTVANGTYDMYIVAEDPNGYTLPLNLMNSGRGSDGFYAVRIGVPVGGVANIPPVANISPSPVNLTLPTNSQLFTGAGSTDPDGTIVSYAWSQISGPNSASFNTPTSVTCTISGMIAGSYVFKLIVTDNNGATGQANVSVNVNNANIPPTAVITPTGTSTIQLPTNSLALSGTSSTDPDGSIVGYQWTFISGPNTPTVGTPTASTSTISGMITGTYIISLRVTDNGGATGMINKTIVVIPANIPPTAQINGSTTVQLPTNSVSLDGTTSFASSGNTITTYAWSTLAGAPNTPTISSPSSSVTTITGLIAGTYNFKLLVTDNHALTGADTITVTVLSVPLYPNINVFTNQTPGGNISGFTSQTPSVPLTNDGQGLNLGVKFRSSIATNVIGVRFYKLVGNNGTHQGELYDSTGTLLASGTFSGETASGWQTLIFSSPVAILANRTYVAAYFTPNGTYADNDNYFNSAVTNGTVTLLANGTSGPNGVYKYFASPSFPSLDNGFKPNYWVDPIVNGGGILQNDGQPITLGMKFRSSVAAYVVGVRFFKVQGNNGVHQGMLYSSTGQLLAAGVFTTESSGGWQTMLFNTPFLMSPNTTYVVAYFSPLGTYIEDAQYFLTSGVVNGTLTGLQSGVDGVNAVYNYGASPTFPTSTDNGGNYWVDAIVSTQPIVGCPGCLVGRIACCKIWVSP